MRTMTKALAVAGLAALANAALALPTVTIDSVTQRWPWNNKVDIKYTISDGCKPAEWEYMKIKFTATIDGQTYPIDGSRDVIAKAVDGTHTVTWTNAPSGICSANCSMTASLVDTTGDYMIIDLESGNFAFEDLEEGDTRTARPDNSNARYNTNLYKFDRLVLRRVPRWLDNSANYPSGYPTGDDTNYSSSNSSRLWTSEVDKDYFISVFEMTIAQYTKLGLQNCSKLWTPYYTNNLAATDSPLERRPIEGVSWNTLRGSQKGNVALGSSASSASVLERLNAKTGLSGFDFPTEVMWEIAARAGATTPYWWGTNTDVGRYAVLGHAATRPVGCPAGSYIHRYNSNEWGLYDAIGNLEEFCLDDAPGYANLGDASEVTSPFVPYVDSSAATYFVYRDEKWQNGQAANCRLSNRRTDRSKTEANAFLGIRLSWIAQ